MCGGGGDVSDLSCVCLVLSVTSCVCEGGLSEISGMCGGVFRDLRYVCVGCQ